MYSKIKNTKTKQEKFFRTQQYTIGCYVIEDDNPSLQYGLDCSEIDFHNNLKTSLQKPWVLVETLGSPRT